MGLRPVRVAYGRDYRDVTPTRGVYKGHAEQRFSVDGSVRPAIDNDGREQLSGSKLVAPEPQPIVERVRQRGHQQQQQQ